MTPWLSDIDDCELRSAIEQLTQTNPTSEPVIRRIIAYFEEKLSTSSGEHERERKKPKLHRNAVIDQHEAVTIRDISFQLPARKKYNVVLSSQHLVLSNPKTDEADHTYALDDLQLCACVPSPGSAAKGDTYALFSKHPGTDPLVFNVPHKSPNPLLIQRPGKSDESLTGADEKRGRLLSLLGREGRLPISRPSRQMFQRMVESPSKGKPVVGMMEDGAVRCHANAYLKAKEGCLYFLPEGILYGFKKPTVFFPLSQIASTYFCNVMQHTFNLVLVLKQQDESRKQPLGSSFPDTDEVEFSMIEQSEYTGIDAYIQGCGINNSSMSEENKAPETKAKKSAAAAAAAAAGATAGAVAALHDDEDDEDDDQDFAPSDEDSDPLEYDSEAGDSSGDEAQQEALQEEDETETIEDEEDLDNESASEDGLDEDSLEREERAIAADAAGDEEEEHDITRTDNETDDQDMIMEEEEEDIVDEDEDEGDDARSESLGSQSDQDIDEDMHDASITDDRKEEKDELDDSD